jgi:hypothetical protein
VITPLRIDAHVFWGSEDCRMLGSHFDLTETVAEIAQRNDPLDAQQDVGPSAAGAASPLRFDTLERDIIQVAVQIHSRRSAVRYKCPICDEPMNVKAEEALPEFGSLEVKLHRLACTSCGMATGRLFHPAVGYQELAR